MFEGIKKGGKHSYTDFKMKMISRNDDPPAKIKIKDRAPFSNTTYDFSSLYGGDTYEDRPLKYVFDLKYKDEFDFNNKKAAINKWILSSGKEALYDDFVKGFYFLAECEGGVEYNDYGTGAEVTVEFIAYPFKIGSNLEGDLLWNDVNFYLPDYIQKTKFQINGSKTITLYLSGDNVVSPTVVVDSDMQCTLNGYTTTFTTSKNSDDGFELKPGSNVINIVGTGNIDFQFRKEVL